ncbi:hypothetical protein Anapl_05666 [Anas platyrhynchos]|uniref:Uncharacterized protein n=1 Tax=Anas platyrhynchos TaxID=8839 RepID=R0LHX3_ANAPL|nr:hypothetical protein Anapl_05666 [Anas platyrhynchos]
MALLHNGFILMVNSDRLILEKASKQDLGDVATVTAAIALCSLGAVVNDKGDHNGLTATSDKQQTQMSGKNVSGPRNEGPGTENLSATAPAEFPRRGCETGSGAQRPSRYQTVTLTSNQGEKEFIPWCYHLNFIASSLLISEEIMQPQLGEGVFCATPSPITLYSSYTGTEQMLLAHSERTFLIRPFTTQRCGCLKCVHHLALDIMQLCGQQAQRWLLCLLAHWLLPHAASQQQASGCSASMELGTEEILVMLGFVRLLPPVLSFDGLCSVSTRSRQARRHLSMAFLSRYQTSFSINLCNDLFGFLPATQQYGSGHLGSERPWRTNSQQSFCIAQEVSDSQAQTAYHLHLGTRHSCTHLLPGFHGKKAQVPIGDESCSMLQQVLISPPGEPLLPEPLLDKSFLLVTSHVIVEMAHEETKQVGAFICFNGHLQLLTLMAMTATDPKRLSQVIAEQQSGGLSSFNYQPALKTRPPPLGLRASLSLLEPGRAPGLRKMNPLPSHPLQPLEPRQPGPGQRFLAARQQTEDAEETKAGLYHVPLAHTTVMNQFYASQIHCGVSYLHPYEENKVISVSSNVTQHLQLCQVQGTAAPLQKLTASPSVVIPTFMTDEAPTYRKQHCQQQWKAAVSPRICVFLDALLDLIMLPGESGEKEE